MTRDDSEHDEKEVFLNEKPVMSLVTIRRKRGDPYVSEVAKSIDTTYAHTVKILNKLEDIGLVKSEKKGRKKFCQLTDKGEEYAVKFGEIIEEIEKKHEQEQDNSSPIVA